MLKKIQIPLLAAICAFSAFGVSACNTVRGAGADVEQVGESVQDAVDETQEEIKENN